MEIRRFYFEIKDFSLKVRFASFTMKEKTTIAIIYQYTYLCLYIQMKQCEYSALSCLTIRS